MTTHLAPLALITGGSRGLSRSMALHLAERGVDTLFTYRTAVAEAGDVIERIRALGRIAAARPLDVSHTASFDALTESVAGELERTFPRQQLDYLVNNAGTSLNASIAETTAAQLDAIYSVHFKAPFLPAASPASPDRRSGRVVNVSSRLAGMTIPGSSASAAMKAAVETLTRYMAKAFAPRRSGARPRRITANVIAPDAIATDSAAGWFAITPRLTRWSHR